MGWIQPWAIWDPDSATFVIKDDRVGNTAPSWTFPSYDGTVMLSSDGITIAASVDHSSGYIGYQFVFNDYGTLVSGQEYKGLYARYNVRSTTPGNPTAEVTGIEGVAAAYVADEALTFRGGHFRTYVNADAVSTMRTNIGLEASARASYAGGTECVAEAGTAFVGERIWMAPYFTSGSVGNINNFWGLWIYGEHATQRNADAAIFISDAGGGFTVGIDMGDATLVNVATVLKGAPTRGSSDYEYGMLLDSDVFFTGGAAQKSYMLGIFGDRPSGSAATGDSNDALLKISGNNYAANDTNFIFRGLNAAINNRSGGTLGRIEHSLGAQGKSGGTVNNILGLTITAENYGTVSDMFGGLDVLLKNEAAVATLEYGIRIRNENNSIAGPVASAILITDTGANTGWTVGIDMGDATAVTVATVLKGAPTRGSSDYEYGMLLDSDVFFTGGAAQKSYMLGIFGDRPSGSAATGDSNDALLKISGNNYAANDTNFIFRGLNAAINNRSGGTLGRIEHSLGAQGKSGGTVNNIIGLTITAENYGTVSDMFGGLDVLLKNEGLVATVEYGIRIRNENNSVADAVGAAILVSDTGANTGWDYILDFNGASVVVADIRLNGGMVVHQDKADRVMIGALIGICNDNSPADNAPSGGVVLYFDGTDLKAKNDAGQTATLNNAAFS